jgi:hypothetical protein
MNGDLASHTAPATDSARILVKTSKRLFSAAVRLAWLPHWRRLL